MRVIGTIRSTATDRITVEAGTYEHRTTAAQCSGGQRR